MKASQFALSAAIALALVACGGGDDRSSSGRGVVPDALGAATPAPVQSFPPSIIPSTWGRIGLAQIFDYFPSTGTFMPTSQVASDAKRYDLVWGSFNYNGDNDPTTWRANSKALVSRYYIITEDNTLISGHDLNYWRQNFPTWILYACDSSGNPTKDLAYTPGDGFKDVALNIHDQSVINYQVASLTNYVLKHGYNALALDEVIFTDFMIGGNPAWGQTRNTTEYACGTWNSTFTQFTKIYSGRTDPTWTADVVNWVKTARQVATTNHLAVIVNHPAGRVGDPNEKSLLSNVDVTMNESGFSDYGNATRSSFFVGTQSWMKYVQSLGRAFVLINKYQHDSPVVTTDHLEYSIGTYLMGNEGSADLFTVGGNGAGTGYGAEQYYKEYAIAFGTPCGEMYRDTVSTDIYYRRFTHGLSVVNAGDTQTEKATLPSNHQYTDIRRGAVGSTLMVPINDAYVLTTTTNGCQ